MSLAQALIEAAVDVIVSKANTSRQVALDAFMKTARGRELYAQHVAAINADCS